ncbi:MAG: class I SAM-dependent rRNA methyltransferase [Anaerolineales bacterium]
MARLFVKPGREKSLLRRHPWVFSGAVERVDGSPQMGETVELCRADGQFLAQAAYSPFSQIRARVWTFDSQPVDAEFLRRRLERALAQRRASGLLEQSAVRLVYAESDGLPGLIVDRYGDVLVAQFLTAGAEFWRQTIIDLLRELIPTRGIYERSDAEVRALEGLPLREGLLWGEVPPSIVIEEHGLRFHVDLLHGHKTGFYLDQRANRLFVRSLSEGGEVLDCFSYTGGFALNALAGGAKSVLAVDSSAEALAQLRANALLNALPLERLETLEGDVFHVLRRFRDQGRRFDLIILDPPKFAPTAVQVEKAARGYKDINLLAFKLLRPAGWLVTFSCSGGVYLALFQKIVASAALDAGVDAQILHFLFQDADHPIALHFPESAYLKGLACRVHG